MMPLSELVNIAMRASANQPKDKGEKKQLLYNDTVLPEKIAFLFRQNEVSVRSLP